MKELAMPITNCCEIDDFSGADDAAIVDMSQSCIRHQSAVEWTASCHFERIF